MTRELCIERYIVSLELNKRQSDNFTYTLVDVDPVFLRRSLLGKGPNPLDDFTGSMSVSADHFGRIPRFLQVISCKPAQRSAGVIHNRGERLIDLMRDRGRHLSQGCNPRDMRKLSLCLAQGLLGALALRYIPYQSQAEPMSAVPKWADANLDGKQGPILSPMRGLEGEDLPGIESVLHPLDKRAVYAEPRVKVRRRHPDQFLTSVA